MIDVSGVRSSCETFDRNSCRTTSRRSSLVTSKNTPTAPGPEAGGDSKASTPSADGPSTIQHANANQQQAGPDRPTLFDRLNQELEAFGKKAQAALDEGKLQIELLRLRRRRDNAARDLGVMVNAGGPVPVDESPDCYKPAEEVIRAVTDAGLAKVEVRLSPIASIKGMD
jgi:hypothetical protein